MSRYSSRKSICERPLIFHSDINLNACRAYLCHAADTIRAEIICVPKIVVMIGGCRVSSIGFAIRPFTAAAILAAFIAGPAHAQGKLEARYTISMTGISIGKAAWSVDIGSGQYTTSASGRASGMFSVLFDGEGSVSARGIFKDGRPAPAAFISSVTREGDKAQTTMAFDNGVAKEQAAEAVPPASDRVPLTAAHRQGVLDPLSAMLVPITGAYDVAAPEACQRTLPVFDGRRRYDLKLSFKRMERVKAEKGYAGSAVVCAMTFQAQAGHRASSTLVKYLSEGRDIELWLAPVAGTRMLAPFRVSVASMIGSLVVQATQFETMSQTAAKN